MSGRFYEDLSIGQLFHGGPVTLTADAIKAFARDYDPQPFHLDEAAAAASFFQGLAASGWHTAALTMRMFVEGEARIEGGLIGAGIEQMRWPRATRPGDTLRITTEVLEMRPSKSRPEIGLVRIRTTTFNQKDEEVQVLEGTLVVPRRL